MGHPRFSGAEIERRGQELYEKAIRSKVETADNIGKILNVDIETGGFENDDDLIKAGDRLLAKHPGAAIFGLRIGYDAVYALSGTLTRLLKEQDDICKVRLRELKREIAIGSDELARGEATSFYSGEELVNHIEAEGRKLLATGKIRT